MGKHGKPLNTSRYPYVAIKGHPLAHKDGRVRIHRAALYDHIGSGPHECHWCGKAIDWFREPKIVADHVNGDTWDNSEGNLVPACDRCNRTRHLTQRTHCKNGHEFTDENTYWRTTPSGASRMCRACSRSRKRSAVASSPTKRVGLEISLRGATLGDLRKIVSLHSAELDETPVYITYASPYPSTQQPAT